MQVLIFTDGSCLKNPGGPGGWAAILKCGDSVREIVGSEASTTNNRMELQAVISALQLLKRRCCVQLTTDSQYVLSVIAGRTKWRNRKKMPNRDLAHQLWALLDGHSVQGVWIRGHQGHPENERCDELASVAAKSVA